MEHFTSDVVVVGGGPVGMTAALALAARGVRVMLVERRDSTSDAPKAISLDDESLRLYQAAGIADDVLGIVVPGTGTRYFGADGRMLFHAGSATPFRHGHPFKNPFAQPELERVLRQALERHPLVDVRFGTDATAVVQTAESVSVALESHGDALAVDARYTIGADGARSTVRRAAGIALAGRNFDDVWLVVDALDDDRRERYGMHHGDPARPHVIVPGLGGRCRYEFALHADEAGFEGPPPFELIERVMAPHRSITPDAVERAVAYRFNALSAVAWRRGRIFLAGDAAHMMPPFAGQGLNSGLRDVANLAWKLAEALTRPRSDAFLDSYEQERKPHADAVIRSSVRLGRVVMTTNPRLAAYRDQMVRTALETAAGRDFFENMRYRPEARYRTGVLVTPTGEGLAGVKIGQPTVFDSATHALQPLDTVLGDGWALVGVGVAPDTLVSAGAWFGLVEPELVTVPLDDRIDEDCPGVRSAIDLDGRLYAEFGEERGRLALVRPDRFVAAVFPAGEASDVARRLRERLCPVSQDQSRAL